MIKKNKILAISTFVFLTLVLFSCKHSLTEVKEIGNFEELPVKESFEVTYLRSQHGLVGNRMYAPLVQQFKNRNTIMPLGFKLEFLDSNLNTTAFLEANYGEILREEGRMIARDSVILINFKNEELYTEELIWVQDSARVFTDKYVKIVRNDVVIHGKGFESKEDFSEYVIKKITGQYYLDEETITGKDDEKD